MSFLTGAILFYAAGFLTAVIHSCWRSGKFAAGVRQSSRGQQNPVLVSANAFWDGVMWLGYWTFQASLALSMFLFKKQNEIGAQAKKLNARPRGTVSLNNSSEK